MKFCRNYFITFWSVVRIWTFLIKTTNLTEINGNLPAPNVLSRIINEFVKPLVESLSFDDTLFRSTKDSAVEKAIKERIAELQSLLQDNDVNIFDKDHYMLDYSDETAIIEFLPTKKTTDNMTNWNTFKDNLNDYKKIREKIRKLLTNESVADKSKTFVLKTLDDLIKKIIQGQCNWKRAGLEKTEEPYLIANKWKERWRRIKHSISKFVASNHRRNNNIPKYIQNLHTLLKRVTQDADLISKKYQLQCEFVPKVMYLSNTEKPISLKNNWEKIEENRCQNVAICSKELGIFMLNFYKSLNETTVTVLKNYAEMYIKDVNTYDVEEKDFISSLLVKTGNDLEGYIREVFIKETIKFTLDEHKNPDANIKFISHYIKNNINNIKEKVRNILRTQLVNMNSKMVAIIMYDIKVNLDVDLGNLEQEFLKQICTVFRLCNGRFTGRRQNLPLGKVNKNNINVQLQLTLDNELPRYKGLQGLKSTNLLQYVSDISVTRTTPMIN